MVMCTAERREERRGCPVRSHVEGLLDLRGEAGGGTAAGAAESSGADCGAVSKVSLGGERRAHGALARVRAAWVSPP